MEENRTLTSIPGVLVGHHTLPERPTGCTAILVQEGAVAGVDVRGAAPGTRETDLLSPVNTVQEVHAVLLSGGSAFGLDSATGVVRYLEERGVGFDVGVAKVPIVPAAVLFDLTVGKPATVRPTADSGYQAALSATSEPVQEGSVGAGAGATVGKLGSPACPMRGGLGSSLIRLPGGIQVAALIAVNAVGDVVHPATGKLLAGALNADGTLSDLGRSLGNGSPSSVTEQPLELEGRNTTIGVVATNAKLDKAQATKLAQMAQDGLARTLYPAHTPFDGDTLFALATCEPNATTSLLTLGAVAAEVTAQAIVRAIETATSLPELPSAASLRGLEPKEQSKS